MKLTITDKQLNLLNNILNNDCAYLENCMKKLKDLTIEEKVNVLTKITKLKKDLKKL